MRAFAAPHGRVLSRDVAVVLTIAILVAAIGNALVTIPPLLEQGIVGGDFRIYHDAAARWLSTGAFYEPYQLSGAYAISPGDVLYPPTILYLLVPFLVLPAILWWAVPLTIIAAVVLRFRPAPWAWPLIALAVWWPRDQGLLLLGNPGMWVGAAIAAGFVRGWPAALVVLKPSLAPFAVVGIGTRRWWHAMAVLAVCSVPLVGLWLQYAAVLQNSDGTIGYSLLELPFMLIPVVAWAARTNEVRSPRPWVTIPRRLDLRVRAPDLVPVAVSSRSA